MQYICALFLIFLTPTINRLFPYTHKPYEGTCGAHSSMKSWDAMTTQEKDELWTI